MIENNGNNNKYDDNCQSEKQQYFLPRRHSYEEGNDVKDIGRMAFIISDNKKEERIFFFGSTIQSYHVHQGKWTSGVTLP